MSLGAAKLQAIKCEEPKFAETLGALLRGGKRRPPGKKGAKGNLIISNKA